MYNNIIEADVGGEGLRHLVTRSQNKQLPVLAEDGLAKLSQGSKTDVYDQENPDLSDDNLEMLARTLMTFHLKKDIPFPDKQ